MVISGFTMLQSQLAHLHLVWPSNVSKLAGLLMVRDAKDKLGHPNGHLRPPRIQLHIPKHHLHIYLLSYLILIGYIFYLLLLYVKSWELS